MISLVHSEEEGNAVVHVCIEIADLLAQTDGFWDALWLVEEHCCHSDTKELRNVRDHLLDEVYDNRKQVVELVNRFLESAKAGEFK